MRNQNFIDCEAKRIFNGYIKIFDYRVEQAIRENKDIVVNYFGVRGRYQMRLTPSQLKLGQLEDKPVKSKFGNYTYKNYVYKWEPTRTLPPRDMPPEAPIPKASQQAGEVCDNRREQQGQLFPSETTPDEATKN